MKKLSVLFLSFFITQYSFGQSVYEVKTGSSSEYSEPLLIVVQTDGNGFIRKKLGLPPVNNSNEILLQQILPISNPELPNDSLLYFKSMMPINIDTAKALFSNEFIICYKINSDGSTIPFGVIKDRATIKKISSDELVSNLILELFHSITSVNVVSPSPEFFSQYFVPTDNFFVQLFKSNSKDITSQQQNTNLFLFIVANTNDKEIGVSAALDMASYLNYFKNLTTFLGIRFTPITISGSDYNKQNVINGINKKLVPRAQDIVVFYYTGHGFRLPRDNRRYPYIDLRANNRESYVTESLNMQTVYDMIVAKKARLNIVLSDCCNTYVESTNAKATGVPSSKDINFNWSYANCKELFLNPKPASIFVTSADADQKATSNDRLGGFFGYYFQASLNSHLNIFKKFPSWDAVLQSAKKQTSYKASRTYCSKPYVKSNICYQVPIFTTK